jgi:hypothetical protein
VAATKAKHNPEIAQLVDELGDIDKELAPHRLAMAREEAVRKLIRAHYDNAPADEPAEACGQRFVVLLGAKAIQATIDYPKLIKAIGLKAFASFATATLAAVEKFAPNADVVTRAHSGARSLKLFERASKAA